MLSPSELATIRASLRFWRDEIVPHGNDSAKHYLDDPVLAPLDRDSIEKLISCFQLDAVRNAHITASGIEWFEKTGLTNKTGSIGSVTVVFGPYESSSD